LELAAINVAPPLLEAEPEVKPEVEPEVEVEPKVEPEVDLAVEPKVDPEVALDVGWSLPPSEVEVASPLPAAGVAATESLRSSDTPAAVTPAAPGRAKVMGRLTRKHYLAAAAGLAILLLALFAWLRSGPAQKLTATPTPELPAAAATVAAPSPPPTEAPAVQPGLAASPPPVNAASTPSSEKAAAGKGAAKSKPDPDAAAREKERRRREILKTLQQKDNQ
jgi:hypothetical protein